jgi:hypothetical protein
MMAGVGGGNCVKATANAKTNAKDAKVAEAGLVEF